MGDIVQFVWRLVPDWLADRLEELFRAPFAKVLTRVVIVTLSLTALCALPAGGRDKVKLVALLRALAIGALEIFRPLEQGFSWL
jgi:hypothetical protein